jgi:hypothetical protein
VEGQAKDHAGNLSPVAADSIGLDLVPPTGTVSIDGGAAFTGSTVVMLTVAASDSGGSGLSGMRVKHIAAANFDDNWLPVTSPLEWRIPSQDGEQGIDVEFRDRAGNTSALARDAIALDGTAPTPDWFWINGGRPYVLPEEPLEFTVYTHDNFGGSGVDAAKYTVDGGTTFSEWMSLKMTNRVTTVRPAQSGLLSVRVVVRDVVGNESEPSAPTETHFVEASPPWLGTSGTVAGTLSSGKDVDAVALDLLAGDVLSIKVKAAFPVLLDLARPTGERVVENAGAAGLASFTVPETGRYVLIAREAERTAAGGAYAVTVSVKPSKAGAKWKGTSATGEISFTAARGSTLKAALKGAGLDPSSVTVTGPEGEVAATAAGKAGSAKLVATLDKGTGTYRIRFTATGPVAGSLSLSRPKKTSLVEAE